MHEQDAREMAVLVAALLLIGSAFLGTGRGLQCYCNTTASIVVHAECLNNPVCGTDYMCTVERYYSNSDQRYNTEWGCLKLILLAGFPGARNYCSGGVDSVNRTYKCCNDSDNCNKFLDVTVPAEMATTSRPEHPSTPSSSTPSSSTPSSSISSSTPSSSTPSSSTPSSSTSSSTPSSSTPSSSTPSSSTPSSSTPSSSTPSSSTPSSSTPSSSTPSSSTPTSSTPSSSTPSSSTPSSSTPSSSTPSSSTPSEPSTTPSSTTLSSTSSSVTDKNGGEKNVGGKNGPTTAADATNQPATVESMLFVWLTVGMAGLGLAIAFVGAATCIGILLHYKYVKRKVMAAGTSSRSKPATKA